MLDMAEEGNISIPIDPFGFVGGIEDDWLIFVVAIVVSYFLISSLAMMFVEFNSLFRKAIFVIVTVFAGLLIILGLRNAKKTSSEDSDDEEEETEAEQE